MFEKINSYYQEIVKSIVEATSDTDAKRLVAKLVESEYQQQVKLDSVVHISRNDISNGHAVTTYAMKLLSGTVYVITFELRPDGWWSIQSNIL